eukprot:scaffold124571_cov26-Prasinocladus_malaysianus.AAC.1
MQPQRRSEQPNRNRGVGEEIHFGLSVRRRALPHDVQVRQCNTYSLRSKFVKWNSFGSALAS